MSPEVARNRLAEAVATCPLLTDERTCLEGARGLVLSQKIFSSQVRRRPTVANALDPASAL
jgi:hypothetical protein